MFAFPLICSAVLRTGHFFGNLLNEYVLEELRLLVDRHSGNDIPSNTNQSSNLGERGLITQFYKSLVGTRSFSTTN